MNWVLRGEMRVLGALRQERPWPVPRRMIPSAWWGDGGRRGQIAGVIQRWNLWERESVCCVLPGAGSDAVAGVDCRGQHGSLGVREWATAIIQDGGACDLNQKILDIFLRQRQQHFLIDQIWGVRERRQGHVCDQKLSFQRWVNFYQTLHGPKL